MIMKTTQKKISNLLFFASVLTLSFSSCKKPEINTDFDIDGAIIEYTVEPNNTMVYDLGSKPVTLDLDAWAAKYKFDKTKIKAITISEVNLVSEDTTSILPYNFDIVKSVEGFIKGNGKSETLIVSDKAIEKTAATRIKVDVKDQEIKDFITGNSVDVSFRGELNDTVKHAFKIKAELKYKVNVDIIK
jgi:hypothetical protein